MLRNVAKHAKEGNTEAVENDVEDWTIVFEGNKTTHTQGESGRAPATGSPFSLGARHVSTWKVRESDLGRRVLKSTEKQKKVGISGFAGKPFNVMQCDTTKN